VEKKGFFGPKKEIMLTEKGRKELEERKFELQKNWDHMVTMWKSWDKQKLQQYMDDNRSILPTEEISMSKVALAIWAVLMLISKS